MCDSCCDSPGPGTITCPNCKGAGTILTPIRKGPLQGDEERTCGRCRGTGKVVPPPPVKVEFMVAWADHTWTTEVHAIPREALKLGGPFDEVTCDAAAVKWANDNLMPLAKYGQVAMFAVSDWPQE